MAAFSALSVSKCAYLKLFFPPRHEIYPKLFQVNRIGRTTFHLRFNSGIGFPKLCLRVTSNISGYKCFDSDSNVSVRIPNNLENVPKQCRNNELSVHRNVYSQKSAKLTGRRPFSPAGSVALAMNIRPYSTDSGGDPENQPKVKVIMFPGFNLFKRLRAKMFEFIIRGYFDSEFSIETVDKGARQAFLVISESLSEGNLDNLVDVLSPKLFSELRDILEDMSLGSRSNLLVERDEIVSSIPDNMTVHYTDDGRKFIFVVMKFICLSSRMEGISAISSFTSSKGPKDVKVPNIVQCFYEFQREVTEGAEPDWIVTHISHGNEICTTARGMSD